MKNSEAFEKKCGKFLFEHKRISLIKEKDEIPTTIIKKEIESSEDDKNINSSIKKEQTISVLCDSTNSQILNQLKEDLNLNDDSEESIFISSAILNSSLKDLDDEINIKKIIEFKKNVLAGTILSQNVRKNIKIIKNEIFETKKNYKNIIYEKKNMIILKALIYLNKDDITYSFENFKKKIPDYNKSKNEEDNKFEKKVYIKIEDRIREYLNKIKYDKLSQLRDMEFMYIQKLMDFQKKSDNYKHICIKGIIIGLLNIINDLIGKEYIKLTEEQKNEELDKGSFILDIFEKYEMMKTINIYIEKDFDIFINDFKEEYKFKFEFVDLISDIYWDYVLRIKEINKFFSNNYGSENINSKLNETFDKIVDILINIDLPYKKIIGDKLGISCIKKEKYYLMEYIIKYKNPVNKKEKSKEKEDKIHKLNMSPSCDNIKNNKQEKDDKKNIEEENKEITNEQNKEDNKEDNKEENNICDEINTFDLDDKKIDLNLDMGKSLSMDLCKNKLSDKDSIDKVYNYILYGENESEKKKTKKKHKRRKKNKIIILLIYLMKKKEKLTLLLMILKIF